MTGHVTVRERDLTAQIKRSTLGWSIWNARTIYVSLYLAAIVTANLLVTWLGAWITPVTAFASIGLSITTRDTLHDVWEGRGLWWRMTLLIAAGSVLSWLLNRNAGRVALASFTAFIVSGAVDTLVYAALSKWSRFERVNWSNLVSSAVDSVLFPVIAFGWPLDPAIVYGQATAKLGGGLFWILVMMRVEGGRR